MLVLVTSWYAAIDSDRTYHMRVTLTEYNTILPALKKTSPNLFSPDLSSPELELELELEPDFRELEPEPVPMMALALPFSSAEATCRWRRYIRQGQDFVRRGGVWLARCGGVPYCHCRLHWQWAGMSSAGGFPERRYCFVKPKIREAPNFPLCLPSAPNSEIISCQLVGYSHH